MRLEAWYTRVNDEYRETRLLRGMRKFLAAAGLLMLLTAYYVLVLDAGEDGIAPPPVRRVSSEEKVAATAGMGRKSACRTTRGKVRLFGTECTYVAYGSPSSPRGVLLLHGKAFSSKTWETLGTLPVLSEDCFRFVVALDLPGGDANGVLPLLEVGERAKNDGSFLGEAITRLFGQDVRPVVVAPSFSGEFALPLILSEQHASKVSGFVSVATYNAAHIPSYKLVSVTKIPALIVYGEEDKARAADAVARLEFIPRHKTVMIPNAGHAAYMQQPELFHRILVEFLDEADAII